jgi:hypothetical protein
VGLVAAALFFIGVVLCVLGIFAVKLCKELKRIWEDDINPCVQHEFLLRRFEARFMVFDAGYECPDWLKDEDEEEGVVLHLTPNPEPDSSE